MKAHNAPCGELRHTFLALAAAFTLASVTVANDEGGALPAQEPNLAGKNAPAAVSGDFRVPLGSSGLSFLPPSGWRSKPCTETNQVLLMVSANQKDSLHAYNFGPIPAKARPQLVLAKMAEGVPKAIGADAKQWKLTETRTIKSDNRHAILSQYQGVSEKEQKHIMALTLIHDETVWVVYSISELESVKTLHDCLLGIVSAPPVVGASNPPPELFTTEILDDVDYHMLNEEKSYLKELDGVQQEVIRRTHSPAK